MGHLTGMLHSPQSPTWSKPRPPHPHSSASPTWGVWAPTYLGESNSAVGMPLLLGAPEPQQCHRAALEHLRPIFLGTEPERDIPGLQVTLTGDEQILSDGLGGGCCCLRRRGSVCPG